MGLLHGKQIAETSVSLVKLDGTGVVEFTDQAIMSFAEGAVLTTEDANIVNGTDVVNKNYVDAVAAVNGKPVYQRAISADQSEPTDNEFNTNIQISSTPLDNSRVNVYVNGQLQRLGDGDKTTDCYFSGDGGMTAKIIADIAATDFLFWNGIIAGFRISDSDQIDIIYEEEDYS